MRVLVTGGTGTVGRAWISRYGSGHEVYTLSRSEPPAAQIERDGLARAILGAVEDSVAVHQAVRQCKPQVVIHAAAMKHVDLCEKQPRQAALVNVRGTVNVIDASVSEGVERLIFISTDKACSPSNVYGWTKALAERAVIEANSARLAAVAVRLGNVIGSRGSVTELWRFLGGPLPVTDPDMRRFFISQNRVADSIQVAMSAQGCVIVPELKWASIGDVASVMANGRGVTIIGRRPGERQNEMLISDDESALGCNGYYFVYPGKGAAIDTETAQRMSVEEIRELVE